MQHLDSEEAAGWLWKSSSDNYFKINIDKILLYINLFSVPVVALMPFHYLFCKKAKGCGLYVIRLIEHYMA